MMEAVIFELLRLIDNGEENKHKRLLASLWISSIAYGFVKLDAAHCISRTLEYQLGEGQKKLPPKTFELKVKDETDRAHPRLKRVLWFDLSHIALPCLTDINFASKLILNVNEFYIKFILPVLELISPKINEQSKELLLSLVNIYALGNVDGEASNEQKKTFTLSDIRKECGDSEISADSEESETKNRVPRFRIDETVRNPQWKLALGEYRITFLFNDKRARVTEELKPF